MMPAAVIERNALAGRRRCQHCGCVNPLAGPSSYAGHCYQCGRPPDAPPLDGQATAARILAELLSDAPDDALETAHAAFDGRGVITRFTPAGGLYGHSGASNFRTTGLKSGISADMPPDDGDCALDRDDAPAPALARPERRGTAWPPPPRCAGTTAAGKACRAPAATPGGYCRWHHPDANRRPRARSKPTPPPPPCANACPCTDCRAGDCHACIALCHAISAHAGAAGFQLPLALVC